MWSRHAALQGTLGNIHLGKKQRRHFFGMKNDNTLLGIAMMLGSVLLFTILNSLVKLLGDGYPVNQIVFFRNAFALIPVAGMVAAQGGIATLRTGRPMGHVWRGVVGLATMVMLFWSFTLLPLADAVALNFTSPLLTTALSVPLLGEHVGVHRWSAVAIGFVGVVIMAHPGGELPLFGSMVALIAALGQALAVTTVRQLSRTEPANAIVFYFTLMTTLVSALSLPFSWVPVQSWRDFALFLACGLVGGSAQLLMTRAYSMAPSAVVAPFNYTSILLAAAIGWMLWSEVPTTYTVIGATLVVASGLYILYRETRLRRPSPPTLDS